MHKKTAICLVSLVVCLVLFQPKFASSAVVAQRTIGSSGTIQAITVNQPTINTLLVAYGYSFFGDTASFVASHFNFLICDIDPNIAKSLPNLKKLNPSLKILIYKDIMARSPGSDDWDMVNTHEDWFLHDINGNRLVNKYFGWYAMDVGNLGWRNYLASWVNDKLVNNPSVDGVMTDDTWEDFFAGSGGYNPWTVPLADVPVSIKTSWHSNMIATLSLIKQTIGAKLLIPNTTDNYDYVNVGDGKVYEGFIHPDWWPSSQIATDWDSEAETLKFLSQQGKYVLAISGTTTTDPAVLHDTLMYCWASYLLGNSGPNAAFAFNNIYSADGSRGYYPEFAVSLGFAINDYYQFQSVYSRDFSVGKVLVNPSPSSYTITFSHPYKTVDGQTISSITLDAYSGMILFNP